MDMATYFQDLFPQAVSTPKLPTPPLPGLAPTPAPMPAPAPAAPPVAVAPRSAPAAPPPAPVAAPPINPNAPGFGGAAQLWRGGTAVPAGQMWKPGMDAAASAARFQPPAAPGPAPAQNSGLVAKLGEMLRGGGATPAAPGAAPAAAAPPAAPSFGSKALGFVGDVAAGMKGMGTRRSGLAAVGAGLSGATAAGAERAKTARENAIEDEKLGFLRQAAQQSGQMAPLEQAKAAVEIEKSARPDGPATEIGKLREDLSAGRITQDDFAVGLGKLSPDTIKQVISKVGAGQALSPGEQKLFDVWSKKPIGDIFGPSDDGGDAGGGGVPAPAPAPGGGGPTAAPPPPAPGAPATRGLQLQPPAAAPAGPGTPVASTAAGDGSSRNAPARPADQAAFDALPSGSYFVNPADGRLLQKR